MIVQINRLFNATNGATGTLNIADVQIEAGSNATPFERLPYPMQLQMCQRYYVRWDTTYNAGVGANFGTGECTSATTATVVIPLTTPMRYNKDGVAPTRNFSLVGDIGILTQTGVFTACTAVTYVSLTANAVRFSVTVGAGMVAGNATQMSVAAGGWLEVTAEN